MSSAIIFYIGHFFRVPSLSRWFPPADFYWTIVKPGNGERTRAVNPESTPERGWGEFLCVFFSFLSRYRIRLISEALIGVGALRRWECSGSSSCPRMHSRQQCTLKMQLVLEFFMCAESEIIFMEKLQRSFNTFFFNNNYSTRMESSCSFPDRALFAFWADKPGK